MPKGMGYGKGEREYAANEFDKKQKSGKQQRRIKKMAKMLKGQNSGRQPLGAGSIVDDIEYEMHCRKVAAKASMPKKRSKQAPMRDGKGNKIVALQSDNG